MHIILGEIVLNYSLAHDTFLDQSRIRINMSFMQEQKAVNIEHRMNKTISSLETM